MFDVSSNGLCTQIWSHNMTSKCQQVSQKQFERKFSQRNWGTIKGIIYNNLKIYFWKLSLSKNFIVMEVSVTVNVKKEKSGSSQVKLIFNW